MFCIILDKDGKEISREQKPKRWCPRNGFWRARDGNFYKRLGDPRIIETIKEKEKEQEKLTPLRTPLPAPACEESDKDKYAGQIHSAHSYSLDDFKALLRYNLHIPRGYGQSTMLEYRKVSHRQLLGIVTLDRIPMFERVDVYPFQGLVKYWIRRKDGVPDYVVKQLVKI
jgi:hypothetical protein